MLTPSSLEFDSLVPGCSLAAARAIGDELEQRYAEPHRFYHTLEHVHRVLDAADALADALGVPNKQALLLSAWFHDAVYDPRAIDNEEQSAALALRMLSALDLSAALIARVERMILATRTHLAGSEDIVCQVLLDADLEVLGAEPDRYDAYAHAIRQEYAWVPRTAYTEGRLRVLASFLERERLYNTLPFYEEREARARENLQREMQRLRSGEFEMLTPGESS